MLISVVFFIWVLVPNSSITLNIYAYVYNVKPGKCVFLLNYERGKFNIRVDFNCPYDVFIVSTDLRKPLNLTY